MTQAALPIFAANPSRPTAGFHVMTKPIGPICNLDCKYCFYLEKEKLYPSGESWKMSDETLDRYVREYIQSQDAQEIQLCLAGGRADAAGGGCIFATSSRRSFSGNMPGERPFTTPFKPMGRCWMMSGAGFFAENHFLIGLSIDGPRELHDRYRVDKKQQPTFDAVMRGLSLLKKHGVDFNTLTVVNRANSRQPLAESFTRFLQGDRQFIYPVHPAGGASGSGAAESAGNGSGGPAGPWAGSRSGFHR